MSVAAVDSRTPWSREVHDDHRERFEAPEGRFAIPVSGVTPAWYPEGARSAMSQSTGRSDTPSCQEDRLRVITPHVLRRLDAALASVGAFGEVRLVVLKGRVRFIEVLRSESLAQPDEARPVLESSDAA